MTVKDELKVIKAKAEVMRAQQVKDTAKLDSVLAKIREKYTSSVRGSLLNKEGGDLK